jgi:menaquinone-dependent protoporphyrinogen oxidase
MDPTPPGTMRAGSWEVSSMRILVTAASKHGATEEMAEWIGEAMGTAGAEAVVRQPDDVATLEGFDAVVLGSAVYAGHWLESAKSLADRLGPDLARRPVYLFSTGPAADPLKPEGDPADAEPMLVATNAVAHEVFAGRIDRKRLGFGERAIVTALRVPDGDYRDRAAVEAWARQIVTELAARPVQPVG